VVLIAKNARSPGRVGFTVPKNVGKAHVRNLVKRRLRHIIHEHLFMLEKRDLVVLALPEAANASFQDLQKDIERAYEGLRSRYRP
jgi:ribonuclease P protein component